ncbi:MAG: hypothetical protein MMC23_000285 [Stictis urceolatum]|nr:hypothetical protein [Stictis urceolata]
MSDDINHYIQYRIDRGPEHLRRVHSERTLQKLAKGSKGMFLWVSCQLDQLSRARTSHDIQATLNFLPHSLYQTFSQILYQIPEESEVYAVKALRWLSYTAAPLSLSELTEAIAIDKDSSSLRHLAKLFDPEDIFQICGSLLRRSDSTNELRLAHSSVYEFLTGTDPKTCAPSPYQFPKAAASLELAKACLTYLSFADFALKNMQAIVGPIMAEQISTSKEEDNSVSTCHLGSQEYHFFDYASQHWWKHLPNSQEHLDELWPKLAAFFDLDSGNFRSGMMILRHLHGTYRYPAKTQPLHFCASHNLYLIAYRLLANSGADVNFQVEDCRSPLHMAIENGCGEMVQCLLNNDADTNARTADGRTALQLAMESGHEALSTLLIQAGADIDAKFSHGETPLSVAVANQWHSHTQFLLRVGADPNKRCVSGRTPLHVAANIGTRSIISSLLDAGADPTLGNNDCWTALHVAASYGQLDAAQALIAVPSSHFAFERVGWTPLHAAIDRKHTSIVRLFSSLARGVSDIILHTQSRQTRGLPLVDINSEHGTAMRSGTGKMMGTGTMPDQPSRTEGSVATLQTQRPATEVYNSVPTPLVLATTLGYFDGVDILLEAGVNENDIEKSIRQAIIRGEGLILTRLVNQSSSLVIYALSLKRTPNEDETLTTEAQKLLICNFEWGLEDVLQAIKLVIQLKKRSLCQVLIEQSLLIEDGSVFEKAARLTDLLAHAVRYHDLEALQMISTAGADLTKPVTVMVSSTPGASNKDVKSMSLLHLAAYFQDLDIVDYLLANTFHIELRDELGRTPLHHAVLGHLDEEPVAVEHLILNGASVSSRDLLGRTPLHLAACFNEARSTECLIIAGASIAATDFEGRTPLHLAACYGGIRNIQYLLIAGASVAETDSKGRTPLHHCAFIQDYSSYPPPQMLCLLDQKASIFARDEDGLTSTELAFVTLTKDDTPGNKVELLLNYQGNLVNTKFPPLDSTALHFAVKSNWEPATLDLLRMKGADLEAEDRQGRTPLQVSTTGAQAHSWLIRNGAVWKE